MIDGLGTYSHSDTVWFGLNWKGSSVTDRAVGQGGTQDFVFYCCSFFAQKKKKNPKKEQV